MSEIIKQNGCYHSYITLQNYGGKEQTLIKLSVFKL